jgi:hypothetical protein
MSPEVEGRDLQSRARQLIQGPQAVATMIVQGYGGEARGILGSARARSKSNQHRLPSSPSPAASNDVMHGSMSQDAPTRHGAEPPSLGISLGRS